MTDQTRWGIPEVHRKNKAIKKQKDLVSSAMECVVKMDESGITDLMIEIEAEYERKYGKNVAKKYTKTVLQYSVTDFIFFFFFSEIKCTRCTFGLEVLVYMTLGWTLYGTLFILFRDKVYYQISVHARECVFLNKKSVVEYYT